MIFQIWHIFRFVCFNRFDKTTNATIHPSVRITEQKRRCMDLVWFDNFFSLHGEMINGTSIGIKVCKKYIPIYREPFVILWFKAHSGECRKRRLIDVNIIHCNWTIRSNAHSVVHIEPKYFKPIRTTYTHKRQKTYKVNGTKNSFFPF